MLDVMVLVPLVPGPRRNSSSPSTELELPAPVKFEPFLSKPFRDITCVKGIATALHPDTEALLRRAIQLWNSPAHFDDAQVTQVKRVVRALCQLPETHPMKGFVTQDTISFVDHGARTQHHVHLPSNGTPTCVYKFTGEFDMHFNRMSDVLEVMEFM